MAFNISLAMTDPEGNDLTEGIIRATADKSANDVLKGTYTEETPNPTSNLKLEANEYRIHYFNTDDIEQYLGNIIVINGNSSLVELLEANNS